MLSREHPLAQRSSVTPEELLQYPFIIETPGCNNDILHLLEKYPHKPQTVYSFRDDTLIVVFVKHGLGVTISQELAMQAFANNVEIRPLVPESFRTIGLAFARTASSITARTLLEYLQANLCRNGARADALKACAPLSDPDKNPRTDAIKQSTV